MYWKISLFLVMSSIIKTVASYVYSLYFLIQPLKCSLCVMLHGRRMSASPVRNSRLFSGFSGLNSFLHADYILIAVMKLYPYRIVQQQPAFCSVSLLVTISLLLFWFSSTFYLNPPKFYLTGN